MKRSGPLLRKARLRPRRTKPRRVAADRVRDPGHLAIVRSLPCVCKNLRDHHCEGVTQASHDDNGKGIGLKTSDLTCVPMCASGHRQWTDHNGPFAGWDRERRRTWFAACTALTLQKIAYHREFGRPVHW
jgi:hypothetical protein